MNEVKPFDDSNYSAREGRKPRPSAEPLDTKETS
jgi:hypothetical protein